MSSKKIVDELRRLRVESKIPQFDFAEITGYDRSSIALLETGARPNPKLGMIADLAHALDHKLVIVEMTAQEKERQRSTRRRNKVRKNLYRQQNPEFIEKLILHYLELGYRGKEADKTLGQVVRESRPKIKGTPIMNTPKTLNFVIEKVKGYWHYLGENWTASVRTPYPEHSSRSDVVSYLNRTFPGCKIIEMEE
jgi:transcriptional regulator with XRE-family HTH domain